MLFQRQRQARTVTNNPGSLLANGWRDAPNPPPGTIQTTNVTPYLSDNPNAVADSIFNRAYRAEQARDIAGAEALYEQIVLKFPSAPSARLANDRLNSLRTRLFARPAALTPGRAQPQGQTQGQNQAGIDYVIIGDDKRVITVNSPVPARNLRPDGSSHAGISQIYNSEILNKLVCSRTDLYDDGANWCGMVRRDDGSHLVIEVRDVNLKSFGQIGIGRSACTGGTFLNWFSKGTTLRVARNCMVFKG